MCFVSYSKDRSLSSFVSLGNEKERFYPERRCRIIRLKHNDSKIFTIIRNSLDNFEMQSNSLLML